MDSLNSNKQSATGKSVFSKHKFDKVAPVSGDILLPGTEDNKKSGGLFGGRGRVSGEVVDPVTGKPLTRSRRMRAIGITSAAFAVVLIVVIVGVLIFAPRRGKSPTSTAKTSNEPSAETLFTDYLSYLFYGDDSGDEEKFAETWEKISFTDIGETFAEQKLHEERSDERTSYFQSLEDKYSSFRDAYNNDEIDSRLLDSASAYFYSLSRANINLSEDEIVAIYSDRGSDAAKDAIAAIYNGDDELNFMAEDYVNAQKEFLSAWLDVVAEADEQKCLSDSGIASCDLNGLTSYSAYGAAKEKGEKATEIISIMRENAIYPIYGVYADIFNINTPEVGA